MSKIRTCLLAKEKHLSICGNLEVFHAAVTSLEGLFSDLTKVKELLPALYVSKLRTLQTGVKAVRTYSLMIHGVNLVVNRMPAKASRERAAQLREQPASIIKPVSL